MYNLASLCEHVTEVLHGEPEAEGTQHGGEVRAGDGAPAVLVVEGKGLLQPEQLLVGQVLHRLSRAGVSIALDDFGTGYASLSHLNHVRVIKAVAKIGTSYYPEIMKKVWIVNVPWAFAAVWNLVSPMLPEHTRNKVSIMGKNFLPQLLTEIDASELPPELPLPICFNF